MPLYNESVKYSNKTPSFAVGGEDMETNGKTYHKTLSTIIFEKIRHDILHKSFHIGEKLVEAQIADRLNVSRTPVREALKQLELEGLVECLPNRGMIVKGITSQDIEDIFTVRFELEGLAIQWAMLRSPEDLYHRLSEIYDLMDFYAYRMKFENFIKQSALFHEVIYEMADSRYLQQLLSDYQYYLKLSRDKSIKTKGRMACALKEYKKILDAIETGDVCSVVQAMEDHIKNVQDNHLLSN